MVWYMMKGSTIRQQWEVYTRIIMLCRHHTHHFRIRMCRHRFMIVTCIATRTNIICHHWRRSSISTMMPFNKRVVRLVCPNEPSLRLVQRLWSPPPKTTGCEYNRIPPTMKVANLTTEWCKRGYHHHFDLPANKILRIIIMHRGTGMITMIRCCIMHHRNCTTTAEQKRIGPHHKNTIWWTIRCIHLRFDKHHLTIIQPNHHHNHIHQRLVKPIIKKPFSNESGCKNKKKE